MSDSRAVMRFSATRHGVLSRFALLPWEDPKVEYSALLAELCEEQRAALARVRLSRISSRRSFSDPAQRIRLDYLNDHALLVAKRERG